MLYYYIDPGTGSMLFSIVIGVAATLYFSVRALAIKLKMKISSKGATVSTDRYPYVIYCEGKQYVGVFLPVVEEFEKRGLPLTYYSSYEQDPLLTRPWKSVHAEYIGDGNKAFAKLNFLRADVVLMTTPGLDVYQLKRSRDVGHYSHILHAASDATFYRLFGMDYYDSILLTGDYQKEDIRYLEERRGTAKKELVTVGCPYLDTLAAWHESHKADEHPFTVLVSPSWGPSALLSRFGEKLLDPLSESGYSVIVRPHPQSSVSEKDVLDRLKERYKDKQNLVWDFDKDNRDSLSKADIMISDFSGIIYDYTLVYDKPVMYVSEGFDIEPYDAGDVPHEAWQFRSLKEFGIQLKESDFPNIAERIKEASDSPELAEERAKARETAWAYPMHSAEHVVDYLVEVQQRKTK